MPRTRGSQSGSKPIQELPLDAALLKAGMRLAVGLSGGADSVALLLALVERRGELGLVLHAAHLHHGLRGAEADGDLEFCRALAERLGVEFHDARVDTGTEARADAATGKAGESIEEAARRLRYGWFRELMASGEVDVVATAHTLDDQAETVLAKFLRGAWTEGLSGIAPKVESAEGGAILRPLLATTRAEIEAYLTGRGQEWREDSSNRQLSFTRNRIRHELLPLLEGWNPRLREHLAQMAELARDEEAWWRAELERVVPQLLLRGRPVRGGGRAANDGLAIDVTRFANIAAAFQRRLLRHAAEQLGAAPDFAATEALRKMALTGRAGQKLELEHGLRAERTPRELRLAVGGEPETARLDAEYLTAVPGEILAPAFGLRVRIAISEGAQPSEHEGQGPKQERGPGGIARLRNWKPGDRVRLRHTSGERKVKEVLERMRVTGSSRAVWPVLELDGRIVWMKGAEVEPEPGVTVLPISLEVEGEDQTSGVNLGSC